MIHHECHVEVPTEFVDLPADLQLAVLNERMCRPDAVSDAMDLECDASAVHPDLKSVRIESLHIEGESVALVYRVEFSEWRACLMESRDWSFRREITGKLNNSRITFVRFLSPERRSTVDEF